MDWFIHYGLAPLFSALLAAYFTGRILWQWQKNYEIKNQIYKDAIEALTSYFADAYDLRFLSKIKNIDDSKGSPHKPRTYKQLQKVRYMISAFFSTEALNKFDAAENCQLEFLDHSEAKPPTNLRFIKAKDETLEMLRKELGTQNVLNLRRGLLRMLIVASALWIAGVGLCQYNIWHHKILEEMAWNNIASTTIFKNAHPPKWDEVASSDKFNALKPDEREYVRIVYFGHVVAHDPNYLNSSLGEQEAVRNRYFDKVIAPYTNPNHLDTIRKKFLENAVPLPKQNNNQEKNGWWRIAIIFLPPFFAFFLFAAMQWIICGFNNCAGFPPSRE